MQGARETVTGGSCPRRMKGIVTEKRPNQAGAVHLPRHQMHAVAPHPVPLPRPLHHPSRQGPSPPLPGSPPPLRPQLPPRPPPTSKTPHRWSRNLRRRLRGVRTGPWAPARVRGSGTREPFPTLQRGRPPAGPAGPGSGHLGQRRKQPRAAKTPHVRQRALLLEQGLPRGAIKELDAPGGA